MEPGGSGWTPILPKPTPDGPNGQLDFGHPYFWPATLAYKGTLIHIGQNGRWERDAIGHNASIRRSLDAVESGSINEFDISAGFNIDNVLYLGATLGIQSVSKRSDITYGEDYGYFNGTDGHATDAAGNVLPVQLDWSDLWQRTTIDGSGVNFKVGAIVRPVAGLRLGVAYHSPPSIRSTGATGPGSRRNCSTTTVRTTPNSCASSRPYRPPRAAIAGASSRLRA